MMAVMMIRIMMMWMMLIRVMEIGVIIIMTGMVWAMMNMLEIKRYS